MPELLSNAPDFSADTVNGLGRFSLAEHRGKVVVIAFSGLTWCPFCRRDAPALQQLWSERTGDDEFQLVMISRRDPQPRLDAEISDFGITFPVILGSDAVAMDYEITGYPTMFVLTRDHLIHRIHVGSPGGTTDAQVLQLRSEISQARRHPTPDERRGCAAALLTFIRGFGTRWTIGSPSSMRHDEMSDGM